jgi:hypothetical protein
MTSSTAGIRTVQPLGPICWPKIDPDKKIMVTARHTRRIRITGTRIQIPGKEITTIETPVRTPDVTPVRALAGTVTIILLIISVRTLIRTVIRTRIVTPTKTGVLIQIPNSKSPSDSNAKLTTFILI